MHFISNMQGMGRNISLLKVLLKSWATLKTYTLVAMSANYIPAKKPWPTAKIFYQSGLAALVYNYVHVHHYSNYGICFVKDNPTRS